MSIINDTLKALEKKQKQPSGRMSADAAAQLGQTGKPKAHSTQRTLHILIGVACTFVISIGVAITYKLRHSPQQTAEIILPEPASQQITSTQQHKNTQRNRQQASKKITMTQAPLVLATSNVSKLIPAPVPVSNDMKDTTQAANKGATTPIRTFKENQPMASKTKPSPVVEPEQNHATRSEAPAATSAEKPHAPDRNRPLANSKASTAVSVPVENPINNETIVQHIIEAVDANDQGRLNVLCQKISRNRDWQLTVKRVTSKLMEASEYVAAERLLKIMRNHQPNNIALRTLTARLYIKEGNTLKGINFLQERRLPIQKNTEYYALLAYAYLQENDYTDSVGLYQQLVSIDSTQASWWMGLGVGYLSGGNKSMALKSFEEAFSHSKPHAPYRYFLKQKIASLQQEKA